MYGKKKINRSIIEQTFHYSHISIFMCIESHSKVLIQAVMDYNDVEDVFGFLKINVGSKTKKILHLL